MLDEANVKKSGEVHEYTQEEIHELINCSKDFYYFTKYIYITGENGVEQLNLRKYQTDIIDIIKDNRFSIIMSSRQSGKCVSGDSLISIKHKSSNQILKIKIEDFFNLVSQESGINIFSSPCTYVNTKISYFLDKVNKAKKFEKKYFTNDYLVLSDNGWKKFKGIR